MEIKNIAIELLEQVKEICSSLNTEEYAQPLLILGNTSLGAHNRHCIEFFQMLMHGNSSGIISYDNRKHDKEIEINPQYALETINDICKFLNSAADTDLLLEVDYPQSGVSTTVETTLKREIIYNIEHLVHHMAIVKIGIKVNFPQLKLKSSFGIAQSTIAFQAENA